MTLPRYMQAAAIVGARIAVGTLRPGEPAPSGAELSRITGYASLTCRRALRALIADGTLTAGPSPNARPRVAAPGGTAAVDATRALSAGLAARRHAAGLTQRDLAALVGRSVTTVGHAETGRTWQSRQFWEKCDKTLDARGALLGLHDDYRAAITADPAPPTDIYQPTDRTAAAMIIPASAPLDDQDPVLLELLRLAAEAMIAHPEAVPPDLLAMLDDYAADLHTILSPAEPRQITAGT
jgi:transcriptional regulator with XRE-family HTH domain